MWFLSTFHFWWYPPPPITTLGVGVYDTLWNKHHQNHRDINKTNVFKIIVEGNRIEKNGIEVIAEMQIITLDYKKILII